MRKFMPKFVKLLMFIVLLNLTGCSTQKLYDMAIDHERGSADLEVKIINLDFGEIAYLENGVKSETAIILLHGFGGDKDNWNRFSANLAEGKRIVIPDLPGHGESVSYEKLDYSILHQAKMLSIFLDSIGVNKVHIIGNSMGGAIAISYTNLNPAKVKSLTLIDALGLKKTKSELDIIVEDTGLHPMLNVCTKDAFKQLLSVGMNKPPYIPGIFMDLLVTKKCARADIENIVYRDMIQDSDLSQIVRNISPPTMIIWGQKDRVLHVDNAQLFHKEIKGSKLVVFEESGHVSLLEIPKKTAKVIESFINENE